MCPSKVLRCGLHFAQNRERTELRFELTMAERAALLRNNARNTATTDVMSGIDNFEKNMKRLGRCVDPGANWLAQGARARLCAYRVALFGCLCPPTRASPCDHIPSVLVAWTCMCARGVSLCWGACSGPRSPRELTKDDFASAEYETPYDMTNRLAHKFQEDHNAAECVGYYQDVKAKIGEDRVARRERETRRRKMMVNQQRSQAAVEAQRQEQARIAALLEVGQSERLAASQLWRQKYEEQRRVRRMLASIDVQDAKAEERFQQTLARDRAFYRARRKQRVRPCGIHTCARTTVAPFPSLPFHLLCSFFFFLFLFPLTSPSSRCDGTFYRCRTKKRSSSAKSVQSAWQLLQRSALSATQLCAPTSWT